jgi:hypothetical protein
LRDGLEASRPSEPWWNGHEFILAAYPLRYKRGRLQRAIRSNERTSKAKGIGVL